jgi:hypothetical protein
MSSPLSSVWIPEFWIATTRIFVNPWQIVRKFNPWKLELPVAMDGWFESFRMIKKSDRQILFVRNSIIMIADRTAAASAEAANHTGSFGIGLYFALYDAELFRPIAYPNGQRPAYSTPAIVVVVIVDPEGVSATFGAYCTAKTASSFNPFGHESGSRDELIKEKPASRFNQIPSEQARYSDLSETKWRAGLLMLGLSQQRMLPCV